jgi:hypothetical protein
MNRLTTGLDAESQFVLGESREDFALLQTEWYDYHPPANPEERYQVDKLIRCEWFQRRYFRIDAQVTEYQSMLVERSTGYELGEAFSKASLIFGRLQRRIDTTEKARTAAKTELERLKKLPPPPQPKQTTNLTSQMASFLKPADDPDEVELKMAALDYQLRQNLRNARADEVDGDLEEDE